MSSFFFEGNNKFINACKKSNFVRKDMYLLKGPVFQYTGGGRGVDWHPSFMPCLNTQWVSPFPRSQPCTLQWASQDRPSRHWILLTPVFKKSHLRGPRLFAVASTQVWRTLKTLSVLPLCLSQQTDPTGSWNLTMKLSRQWAKKKTGPCLCLTQTTLLFRERMTMRA